MFGRRRVRGKRPGQQVVDNDSAHAKVLQAAPIVEVPQPGEAYPGRRRIRGKRSEQQLSNKDGGMPPDRQETITSEVPKEFDVYPGVPTSEQLEVAVKELLNDVDANKMSLKKFRRKLATHLGLAKKDLDSRCDEVSGLVQKVLMDMSAPPTPEELIVSVLHEVGEEVQGFQSRVFLATLSQLLPETVSDKAGLKDLRQVSREGVAAAFRDAFDNPVVLAAGGRPRSREGHSVKLLVVFKEEHANGEPHFHVAVRLASNRSFLPVKLALRQRHGLAAHFSCSHTQMWSAVRYGHIPSMKKTVVDKDPFQWTADGVKVDLHDLAQRPFNAACWKRRREEKEAESQLAGAPKQMRFTKLDLTAIVLAKGLTTKSDVLEYAQEHGSESMQHFVCNRQKLLPDYVEEALEWGAAREQAARDRVKDWDLVCQKSECVCPHGDSCTYRSAAASIFEKNAIGMNKEKLALALRAIILTGPSKTARVPFLVGQSNTGKTTLVLPFDLVFGKRHVFHKPALGSKFALRNLMKEKRFLLWDDYRPVEYAQETVEVPTFLSLFTGQLFEVQVSQAFNDGNPDFQWLHGCVLTAKLKDLWKPWGVVSEEDISHMQNRVEMFHCSAKVEQLKDVTPCAECMCRWILGACQHFDASSVLLPVANLSAASSANAPQQSRQVVPADDLPGMDQVATLAKLNIAVVATLTSELKTLGVVHAEEVTVEDWQSLQAWAGLKPFEQRRLLAAVRQLLRG